MRIRNREKTSWNNTKMMVAQPQKASQSSKSQEDEQRNNSGNDRQSANRGNDERLARVYYLVSFGLFIPALVLSISFGKAGRLEDILTQATGFSWQFLGYIADVLVMAALVLVCLGLHQKKTSAGVILLVLELVIFVIPLVWMLVMATVMGGKISFS